GAIHGVGTHAWIVGRPGAIVLHTPDQGKAWKVQKTGQSLPLHGVFFHDELRGWAVGAAGTILATTDGGNTWKVQRRGGERVALLCAHAAPSSLPADSVAVMAGDEGYLTVSLRVLGPGPASPAPRPPPAPQRPAPPPPP